ncbi:hypothetical protein ACHAW5_008389 [Stephanodiscus triporus]|uniref:RRM domain-containing protein n=1 Tax=Stephanodiscus triporus TaxID=2934178 RepID=A0ABD3N3S2_9STRA
MAMRHAHSDTEHLLGRKADDAYCSESIERSPRLDANEDIDDEAEIESPRNKAAPQATAWLKKVLGVADCDDDCDSPRAVPADAVAEVEATTPSTGADAIPNQSTEAFMEILCSEEIVTVVRQAVHKELAALRIDNKNVVDTAMRCVHSGVNASTTISKNPSHCVLGREDMPDVQDDSSLEFSCNKQGKLQSLDVTPPHGSKINLEKSSGSHSSVEEYPLPEYSKDRSREMTRPEHLQRRWTLPGANRTANAKSSPTAFMNSLKRAPPAPIEIDRAREEADRARDELDRLDEKYACAREDYTRAREDPARAYQAQLRLNLLYEEAVRANQDFERLTQKLHRLCDQRRRQEKAAERRRQAEAARATAAAHTILAPPSLLDTNLKSSLGNASVVGGGDSPRVVPAGTVAEVVATRPSTDTDATVDHSTQASMDGLCLKETRILGHTMHKELAALRTDHGCIIDDMTITYVQTEFKDSTPSFTRKNSSASALTTTTASTSSDSDGNCSGNNANVALTCTSHYLEKHPVDKVYRWSANQGGALNYSEIHSVDKVYRRSVNQRERTNNVGSAQQTTALLVHGLPVNTLPEHISEMFVKYASIRPKVVPDIAFSGPHGKSYVEFASSQHAELAYASLVGEERADKTGKMQKRIRLKGEGYVFVRKMKKGK